jgi:hypothetical protein
MPKASRQVGGKIFGGSPSLANKERNALTFFEQGRILEAELLSLRLIDLGTSNKNIFKTIIITTSSQSRSIHCKRNYWKGLSINFWIKSY